MKKNEIYDCEITALTNEGAGVARIDRMAVFVPFTAVGDRLKVRILKVKSSYAYGKTEEIITPSKDRVTPDCPQYGKCGGCVLRHIGYEAQLSAKQSFVRDAFERIGGITPRFLPIIPCEGAPRYRNKLQMPIGKDADGKPVCGFYAPHSHRIVPCGDCLLQPPVFSLIVDRFCELAAEKALPVFDIDAKNGLRHIYLRKGHYSGEISLCIVAGRKLSGISDITDTLVKEFPDIVSAVLNINPDDTNVILGEKEQLLYGRPYITDTMCGNKILISPKSFYQVNTPTAERLYAQAKEFARPAGGTVLDLYCGAGTIGLSMAREAKEIIGVEIVPEAVENAAANARVNGIENARFILSDAQSAAESLLKEGIRPDVVIIDPPRKGCGEKTCEQIAAFGAQRIVMISCAPATAARDCAYFENLGYKTEVCRAADMFGATAHVECVVLMSRAKG